MFIRKTSPLTGYISPDRSFLSWSQFICLPLDKKKKKKSQLPVGSEKFKKWKYACQCQTNEATQQRVWQNKGCKTKFNLEGNQNGSLSESFAACGCLSKQLLKKSVWAFLDSLSNKSKNLTRLLSLAPTGCSSRVFTLWQWMGVWMIVSGCAKPIRGMVHVSSKFSSWLFLCSSQTNKNVALAPSSGIFMPSN